MAVVSPDTTIDDLLDLTGKLEDEGAIQGQIRLYNAEDPSRVVTDPEHFLDRITELSANQRTQPIV